MKAGSSSSSTPGAARSFPRTWFGAVCTAMRWIHVRNVESRRKVESFSSARRSARSVTSSASSSFRT
ncbi:hypothetical protein [Sorangium sp. So ce204]|uniref:hypothetical protein n=1 Tax=Sorangium sp. So ce204 TaxID=3133288 RepID=UPI003F632C11